MFSRGSGSYMANNKGKDIMEEQDGNNGSPWLLPPRELLDEEEVAEWLQSLKGKEIKELQEAGEALELLRVKEIMEEAEEEQDDGNGGLPLLLRAEEALEWLQMLMRAKFWRECRVHGHEESFFCMHCFKIVCRHCKHAKDEPTHQILKIYHYLYRSVVSTRDMSRLGIDISYIQPYKSNGYDVVHLQPMKKSAGRRAHPGTPRCITCDCLLHTSPNRYCSLSCKYQIWREGEATDEISGPTPSGRLGREDVQGEVTSQNPDA